MQYETFEVLSIILVTVIVILEVVLLQKLFVKFKAVCASIEQYIDGFVTHSQYALHKRLMNADCNTPGVQGRFTVHLK